MISDACRFHWSNMRTVRAADNPSPDRSLQIASRRWHSGQRSEPFKHNDILVDSYILTKAIGSPVNADHEVPGIRVPSRAAFGAPTRRWKPYKCAIHGAHVMFVVRRAGDCGRHEERRNGYVKYRAVELSFVLGDDNGKCLVQQRFRNFRVDPLRS